MGLGIDFILLKQIQHKTPGWKQKTVSVTTASSMWVGMCVSVLLFPKCHRLDMGSPDGCWNTRWVCYRRGTLGNSPLTEPAAGKPVLCPGGRCDSSRLLAANSVLMRNEEREAVYSWHTPQQHVGVLWLWTYFLYCVHFCSMYFETMLLYVYTFRISTLFWLMV